MNKKAQEFFSIIIFFAFAVFLFMIINKYSGKQSELKLDFIGKNQVEIKQIYEKSENDLFFNDQLAKYGAWNAFHKLAERGGYSDLSCPQYPSGYCLINPRNFPDYEKNFNKLFDTNFNNVFETYFKKEPKFIVTVKDNLVVGIATDIFNYSRKTKSGSINYNIKPHFEINLDYSFSDFEIIRRNSLILIQKCPGQDNLKDCMDNEIKKFKETHLTWQPNGCGQENVRIKDNKAAFCVFYRPKGKTVYTSQGNKTVLYKFALEFPAPLPPPTPPPT